MQCLSFHLQPSEADKLAILVQETTTAHSGGERSLGETKYIIGDSYTVEKVWASAFVIN